MSAILDEGGSGVLDEAGSGILDETVTAVAQVGSWWGLDTILKQSRQEFEAYVSMPPMSCPNDGEPLSNAPATPSASGVELFCHFCHFEYPRDWHVPQRPGF